MLRRRGGPGVIGVMATTAVVAGTAGAVHHRQDQRYQNKAMQQQQDYQTQQTTYNNQAQVADLQAQVDALQRQQSTAQPAPAGGGSDLVAKLQQLSNMQTAGLLSPEQYEAAKNRLLTS